MDVVGDSLIHTWGLMTVLIVTALFLTLRSISDRPPDSERSGSS
jgi:hypothetical protein